MGETEKCWPKCLENAGSQGTRGIRLSPWTAKLEEEGAGGAVREDWKISHSSPGKSAEPPNISPKMHPADQVSEAMAGGVGLLVISYEITVPLDVLVNN